MPTVAIIPLKSFRDGKQRLSEAITAGQRANLGKALAMHVGEVAIAADLLPVYVTADAEVASWATNSGFPFAIDPGDGLVAAAQAGVEWAKQSGSQWLVVHSDLPLLSKSDLVEFVARGRDAIAPSSDGGTSAIASGEPIEFAFGPSSFHKHLSRMTSPKVVARAGFLLDIDSPEDLEAALDRTGGEWLAEALR